MQNLHAGMCWSWCRQQGAPVRASLVPDIVLCAVHTEGFLKPCVFTVTQSIGIISPHLTEDCYEDKMSWTPSMLHGELAISIGFFSELLIRTESNLNVIGRNSCASSVSPLQSLFSSPPLSKANRLSKIHIRICLSRLNSICDSPFPAE